MPTRDAETKVGQACFLLFVLDCRILCRETGDLTRKNMSENRSSLFRALLAVSLMLFVVGFVVIKSGAIEKRTSTKMIDGKSKESTSYNFNASRIPIYIKSVVAPITGNQALSDEK